MMAISGSFFARNLRQIEPAHRRHLDIGQQQVELLPVIERSNCNIRIAGRHHLITGALQRARADIAHVLFIIDDQQPWW